MKLGAVLRKATEYHAAERRRRRKRFYHGRDRDAGGTVGGKAINAGRNRRESNRAKMMNLAERDGAAIAGRQQFILAAPAAAPYRPHRMDHILGRQPVSARDLGVAGLPAAQRAALGKELGASRAMNRAIDTAAAQKRRVRRVHDGVNAERGDVSNNDFEPRGADLAR